MLCPVHRQFIKLRKDMFLPLCAHYAYSEMCVFILFGVLLSLQTFYYLSEIEEWQAQLGGSDVGGKNAGFHLKKNNIPKNKYGQL